MKGVDVEDDNHDDRDYYCCDNHHHLKNGSDVVMRESILFKVVVATVAKRLRNIVDNYYNGVDGKVDEVSESSDITRNNNYNDDLNNDEDGEYIMNRNQMYNSC